MLRAWPSVFPCLESLNLSGKPIEAEIVREPAQERGCLQIAGVTAGRLSIHFVALTVLFMQASSLLFVMEFYVHEALKIPAVTALSWNWSHWVAHYGLIFFPVLLLIDAAILAGLQSLSTRFRFVASVWFSLILLGVIVIMGWSTFVSVLPLKFLTDSTPPKQVSDEESGY